ncbi:hypothetical protein A3K48_01150 [candidate division WOR-1 bacterium RIFOXYA12_FULL_52_29]|uniref:Uncharacterized protein n=1 Tax=candidate division WOR-1 bacterium RIFOXYC12_FULL_54_18 TaxID=1802584 RepID=A0A1F4T4Z8_UNCSA|nr:MAG: hypothetical protein A3K44_01150 [candidate division WOR-1 bacterium RIFOXYA2_FULL_51_19]OGC17200.1 MAG: hypothetical protein A3K48_01150 [candidate division WOR-1 bacterium RIFOXYA12_FULL_52_29]OGC26060.1 MAG: hypothetical protein A3K32_01145 [candidate division WOR-1 bacterium RIFOXYB2_FULL_45_9]OGC27617.1 MAG: hypothetical protein A3K49_01150 [candidate division WOR-1 bacterium RIFOXYC12_FULL_54_18]OGC29169.1 MAG: hypothetical protein A2346_00555 [candidate division WOR-1 bacterium R
MKKMIVLSFLMILTMVLLSFQVMAQTADQKKVESYISGLKVKLAAAQKTRDAKRIKLLQSLISEAKASLEKIKARTVEPSKPAEELAVDSQNELVDIKEETNAALASLKNELEAVKADNKDVKVSGVIFFHWQKYTQNAGSSNYNQFDVSRAYLDFKKKLVDDASARVTLDVRRLDTSSTGTDPNKKTQNLFDYLKYAYVEKPVTVPAALQPVPFTLTAKIGLQHTAWIDWADKLLNARFIAKTLLDNEGVMSSSDFGLGVLGKVSVSGFPEVEYHATLLNGAGYSKPESDARKDLGLRLNSNVYSNDTLGSVIVGLFGNAAGIKTDASMDSHTKKQAVALLGLKNSIYSVGLEYLYGTNISGYSLGGTFIINPGWTILARLDNYDPSRSAVNNEISRSIYGLIYDWSKDVRLAADFQSAKTGTGATTGIFYLHSMITI